MSDRSHKEHLRGFFLIAASLAIVGIPTAECAQMSPDYRSIYDDARAIGSYDEAEAAAKAILDQALRDGRRDSLETAELLIDLADVQRLKGDIDSAVQNYELSIEIIQAQGDNLALDLEQPYLGLGKTWLAGEQPDLALRSLDRALHVRQVNEGPHSLEQIETLEAQYIAYRQLGDDGRATGVADRLYDLHSRRAPADSMALVPALLHHGEMLHELREFQREREVLQQAIEIIETHEGEKAPALVEPVVLSANSYLADYYDRVLLAETEEELPEERELRRAARLLERAAVLTQSHGGGEWRERVRALLAIGDFYTVTQDFSRARVAYAESWALLTADDERLEQRKSALEAPVPLFQPRPDLNAGIGAGAGIRRGSGAYQLGFIVVTFTVNRRGRVTDLGLVEITPRRDEDIEAETARAVQRFIYRPRFDGGFVVDSPDQMYRVEFLTTEAPADDE